MKQNIKILALSTFITIGGLTGCSSQATRITPGSLDVSSNVDLHNAKIINIVQLSEKEAPDEKVLTGILTGALVAAAITNDAPDSTQDDAIVLGGFVGEHIVSKKHGKTIYRLTLSLQDGTPKEVFVRGGNYQLGKMSKITIDKISGEVTSLKLHNT